MKKNAGYYLLLIVTWPMKFFPLEFHYIVADLINFFIYRVFAYRVDVVRENLQNSFPDKSKTELRNIEKKFYKGLGEIFVETLYFSFAPSDKILKHIDVDYTALDELIEKKRSVIFMAGHFSNWEYSFVLAKKVPIQVYFVYKKLSNKAFDEFYKRFRSKFARPLEMKETYRQLMYDKNNNIPFASLLISDQRPLPHEIKHWVRFLNQDTPVLLGTEKLAIKTNAAILFLEIRKMKRGYYKVHMELLEEHPRKSKNNDITNRFMKRLEQSIQKSPEQYLWTHKRWKYKREKN
ncbi:MAG: lysophospholipid acyltransferase family protein [Prolixibacteraceae bacterium]|nr:lysophospholipid acyltransferase family protein [Prolixibacteraceae bacterium]